MMREKRINYKVIMFVLFFSVIIMLPTQVVQADPTNNKWDKTIVTIGWSSSFPYSEEIDYAITKWNQAFANQGSDIHLWKVTLWSQEDITFYTGDVQAGYASGLRYDEYGNLLEDDDNGLIDFAEITLDLDAMETLNSTQVKAAIMHEIGHVLGLKHTLNNQTESIMRRVLSDFDYMTAPGEYDEEDIYSMYSY